MIVPSEVEPGRSRLGWSRRKLAQESGLSEGKVWRIENKLVMSGEEAAMIESAFNRQPVNVPLSPVRVPPASPVPPSSGVGTSQLPAVLTPIEEVPPVVYDDLPCGHTTQSHSETDLCPKHPRNEGFRLHSNSELKTFKRCRRKWWLTWYRGLKPSVESPTGALAIGQRIHRALRELYVPAGQTPHDPREALELLITQDWTVVTQRYTHEGLEVPLELRKKFAAEADLERAMIEGYVQWLADSGEDSELEVIAPETYLEVDVTDQLIPFTKQTKIIGKLDVRTFRRRDNVRRFMDHKTLGDFNAATAVLSIDEQMLHYHLLEWLSTEDGEQRCDGAIYNMLRKVKRTATAKPPFYQRVTVHHNQLEIDSYKERLLGTVTDMRIVEEALERGDDPKRWVYPNPTRDCRWDCPMLQVCGMFDDGSRVEDMLSQYFVKGDTLSYYTDENKIRVEGGTV